MPTPSRRRRLVPGSPTRRTAVMEPKNGGQTIDLMAELRKSLALAAPPAAWGSPTESME